MSLLATGAGAAKGLKDLLAQYMLEDRQNELERSNRADEGYRDRALQENMALRRLTQEGLQVSREQAAADRDETRRVAEQNATRSVIAMRPAGREVSPADYERETGRGIPQDYYDKEAYGGMTGDDASEPRSVIKFRGTAQEENQAASAASRDAAAEARDRAADALQKQRDVTNAAAEGRLKLAKDRFEEQQNTVKVGEGGKRSLRSIEQAQPLLKQVKEEIRKAAPDIESNPAKYNTIGNAIERWAKYAKYKMGFLDESSPLIQLTKLLQPIQSAQYLAGSRNWNMVELALAHLADPKQTLARQWEALTQLEQVMPEMREAIVKSESPIHINQPGGQGGQQAAPAQPAAPGGGGDLYDEYLKRSQGAQPK